MVSPESRRSHYREVSTAYTQLIVHGSTSCLPAQCQITPGRCFYSAPKVSSLSLQFNDLRLCALINAMIISTRVLLDNDRPFGVKRWGDYQYSFKGHIRIYLARIKENTWKPESVRMGPSQPIKASLQALPRTLPGGKEVVLRIDLHQLVALNQRFVRCLSKIGVGSP